MLAAVTATTWRGRHGAVLLGPTQDRVARYLDDLTGHGRIRIRTRDLADRLGLERSEAFRILARLRVLGLFGVSNDRGDHDGGRTVWRTRIRHDGSGLDPARRRITWARMRGATSRARARLRERLDEIRGVMGTAPGPLPDPPPAAGHTFAELVAPRLGAWFHERRST